MSKVQVIRGTRYRKWRMPNSTPNSRRPGYAGRIHLQFYDKQQGTWRFVCPKREGFEYGIRGEAVDSESVVTCTHCIKHGTDIVEKMDRVPNLEEFQ